MILGEKRHGDPSDPGNYKQIEFIIPKNVVESRPRSVLNQEQTVRALARAARDTLSLHTAFNPWRFHLRHTNSKGF